ncbi:MAG: hypothetical protein AAFU65_04330 [Pseudomonadota bacterium]
MTRTASAIAALVLCVAAHGRPVSYVGGWTVIEASNRQATSVLVHYTPHPRLSVGWRSEWDRAMSLSFHGAQFTTLAKRWFGENYQGNVYGLAGIGVASGVDDNTAGSETAAIAGVMADWETRRYFASYTARGLEAGDVGGGFYQAARVGVAPYIGGTDDLHTWLMLEIDHRPTFRHAVDATPLLRFFKGAALLELGWSLRDETALVNFTYRL